MAESRIDALVAATKWADTQLSALATPAEREAACRMAIRVFSQKLSDIVGKPEAAEACWRQGDELTGDII